MPLAVRIMLISPQSLIFASVFVLLSIANDGKREPFQVSGVTSTRTISSPTAVTVMVWCRSPSLIVMTEGCA